MKNLTEPIHQGDGDVATVGAAVKFAHSAELGLRVAAVVPPQPYYDHRSQLSHPGVNYGRKCRPVEALGVEEVHDQK